jgi:hypothetical protein
MSCRDQSMRNKLHSNALCKCLKSYIALSIGLYFSIGFYVILELISEQEMRHRVNMFLLNQEPFSNLFTSVSGFRLYTARSYIEK